MTIPEAAELLRVSVSTIRRWIRDGTISAHRAGQRRLLLKRTDVAKAVHAVEPTANPNSRMVTQAPAAYIDAQQEPLAIMAPEVWEDIHEGRELRTGQLMGEYDPEFEQFDIGVLASMIVHSPDRPRRRLLAPDEQQRWLAALDRAQQTSDRIQKRSGVDVFPPSEDIGAEMRDERMRQLTSDADGSEGHEA